MPIVRISNILSSGSVGGVFAYYNIQEKDDNYLLPDKAAVLAMSGATTGKVSILENSNNNKFYQNQRVGYFAKTNEANYDFISTLVRSKVFTDQLSSVLVAGAQPNVSSKDIDGFEFTIPNDLDEQAKIGIFFTSLDNTIALHQRKLEKLQLLKRGFLQLMFPQGGEKVPMLRFALFSSNWEQRKLADLVKIIRSYSLSRNVETNEKTGFRYIHYGDIHKKVADLIISDKSLPKIKVGNYELLKKGDVVVADASEDYIGIAEPALLLEEPIEKIVAGLHTIVLRPHSIDSLYLYYVLHTNNFKKFGGRVGTGMKVFGITSTNLLMYEFRIPNTSEQIKIGAFLKKNDDAIILCRRNLEKLKSLKKVYLKKLFI